jgi:hypothetical protein
MPGRAPHADAGEPQNPAVSAAEGQPLIDAGDFRNEAEKPEPWQRSGPGSPFERAEAARGEVNSARQDIFDARQALKHEYRRSGFPISAYLRARAVVKKAAYKVALKDAIEECKGALKDAFIAARRAGFKDARNDPQVQACLQRLRDIERERRDYARRVLRGL